MKAVNKIFFALAISLLVFSSCKKKETPPPPPPPSPNIKFMMGIGPFEAIAKWKYVTGPVTKIQIFWETGSGADMKKLEIDLYEPVVGAFQIVSSPQTAFQASFNYRITKDGVETIYQGSAGTLNVTSFDAKTISGNFTINLRDQNNNVETAQDGLLIEIPKEEI